jgi:hypothetical protein
MPFTVSLPFWSQGQYIAVTQEPGDGTHTGYLKNSWDFALPFGHEVLAIADGVIVDIRETIPDGDAYQMTQDETWGSGAIGNIVTIRHEQDGKVFYSTYMHLRENSVPVEIARQLPRARSSGRSAIPACAPDRICICRSEPACCGSAAPTTAGPMARTTANRN